MILKTAALSSGILDTDEITLKGGSVVLSGSAATLQDAAGNDVVRDFHTNLYKLGDQIFINYVFDEDVILSLGAKLAVTLIIDKVDGSTQEIEASVTGDGSSASTLLLKTAALPSGLVDTNGVIVKGGSVVLSGTGASLRDLAGNDALPVVPQLTLHTLLVDTDAPTITWLLREGSSYSVGEQVAIIVAFSEDVILSLGAKLAVTLVIGKADGSTVEIEASATGDGTSSNFLTLKTAPLSSALLDTNGITIRAGSAVLSGTGATLRDAAGNDVVRDLPADSYKLGDQISISYVFDKDVILSLGAKLAITLIIDTADGTEEIEASITGDGTSVRRLEFETTPLPSGLIDTNGVIVKAGSVVLSGSGATLRDLAGNDVVLVDTQFTLHTVLVDTVDPVAPNFADILLENGEIYGVSKVIYDFNATYNGGECGYGDHL